MPLPPASFAFPTAIRLGPGVRGELPRALAERGARRPLVVTDRGVAALPWFEPLLETLRAGGCEPAVFADMAPNPRARDVAAGLERYRAHEADAVVCVGGGAPTDVGKAIALLATNPGAILEYAEDAPEPRAPVAPLPPVIALPTTAGTGSEVGRSSVIAEDETGRKRVVFQPPMLPQLVLADPELLVGLPPALTAATGMDAVCHLVEALCATGYHPLCDGIALEGLVLCERALVRSFETPGDLEARRDMLAASMMGAIAFQKGLGVTHACAHALGAVHELHHGLLNGVLLPHALRFNLTAIEAPLTRAARALGLDDPGPEALVRWVERLQRRLEIPRGLRALGVDASSLDRVADLAACDGCLATNPRPASRDELRALLEAAL
ncbi:MAG: iron-containing alcohol dehydrogenase [Planctomycetota bacterium]|nr:MAG: iron-containing alcohol dehydrogenase [Planctomycetota bacterium]